MLSQGVFTLNATTTTEIVAPTIDSAYFRVKNLEPDRLPEDYARAGRVYDIHARFDLTRSTSLSMLVTTGATGCQFQYFQITTTSGQIHADLIEGATTTGDGVTVPSYNVNRNNADDATSVFEGVTTSTGGVIVHAEHITADKAAGGEASATKVITLAPNTEYVFRFTEAGGVSDPTVFFQLGFAEIYNGYNNVWLGAKDNSFVLHGDEETKMHLKPGESINALAGRAGVRVSVIRQD